MVAGNHGRHVAGVVVGHAWPLAGVVGELVNGSLCPSWCGVERRGSAFFTTKASRYTRDALTNRFLGFFSTTPNLCQ